ncbi:MAG TPA: hypothetical protein VGK49_04600 [Ilumatobacteraceae bacterium]
MQALTEPDRMCAAVVPAGYEFYNSLATTVGEIRDESGGPAGGTLLWPDAFPGQGDDVPAAWCRGWDGDEKYVAFIATGDGSVEVLGHESGVSTPPAPGPPAIE